MCKNNCHISNQLLPVYQIQSFTRKEKSLNLRQEVPYLDIYKKQFEKLLSYLKLLLSNCLEMQIFIQKKIAKVSSETKFWYFRDAYLKIYYHIRN